MQGVLQHPPRQRIAGAGAGPARIPGRAVHPARPGSGLRNQGAFPGAGGRTVVCIASGGSLTADDCQRVGRWKAQATETDERLVIVVNECWRLAPFADHLYAADGKWWRHTNRDGRQCIDAVRNDFSGQLWTCDLGAARDYKLHLLHARNQPGIATEHDHVHTGGGNGGMQAVNLAWHLGATRILLLGYDMQITEGRVHWHGQHVNKLGDPKPDLMRRWAAASAPIARDLVELGVDIINCSRQSAAQGWPRRPLEDVLALRLPDPSPA